VAAQNVLAGCSLPTPVLADRTCEIKFRTGSAAERLERWRTNCAGLEKILQGSKLIRSVYCIISLPFLPMPFLIPIICDTLIAKLALVRCVSPLDLHYFSVASE